MTKKQKKQLTQKQLTQIEILEQKYLNKFFYFLKFAQDDIITGLRSKDNIKNDWVHKWDPNQEGKGISDFSTGAERIIYSLLNAALIGKPNSAPIGSDLFFEVEDAFIHIDLKTVQTRNIGDYTSDIFVGNNQNSYNGKLDVNGKEKTYDEACLPTYYTLRDKSKKICLTYFITILYEEENLDILVISILSMPNGELFPVYGKEVLKAGKTQFPSKDGKRKTHTKTIRYKWSNGLHFKLLEEEPKRVKIIYFYNDMKKKYKNKLEMIYKLYSSQKE